MQSEKISDKNFGDRFADHVCGLASCLAFIVNGYPQAPRIGSRVQYI